MNIEKFASGFVGGGVRPHLFRVQGKIGTVDQAEAQVQGFHIKAASLPAASLGIIEVPYRGRKVKIPGDRTFAEWSITCLCTGDFRLRSLFEQWGNQINDHLENTSKDHVAMGNQNNSRTPTGTEDNTFCDWGVAQLDRNGAVIKDYTFYGCWPSEVGAIELDYETTDSVAEFPITLQYTYWTTEGRDFRHATHEPQGLRLNELDRP